MRRDRRKGGISAAAGAPLYWIVDVPRDTVIVHEGATADGTLAFPETQTTVHVTALLRQPAAS